MRRVGGLGSHVCFYVPCIDFPRSARAAIAGQQAFVAVGHTLGSRFGIRVIAGGGGFGSASGDGPSGTISWHWSMTTAAAQLTYDLPPAQLLHDVAFGATFGAGPVFAWVRSSRGMPDAYPADSNSQVTRLGLELRTAGTVWTDKRRRFFFGLELGYQFLPGRREGPYPLDTGSGALPAFDATYNHAVGGFVMGLRFSL